MTNLLDRSVQVYFKIYLSLFFFLVYVRYLTGVDFNKIALAIFVLCSVYVFFKVQIPNSWILLNVIFIFCPIVNYFINIQIATKYFFEDAFYIFTSFSFYIAAYCVVKYGGVSFIKNALFFASLVIVLVFNGVYGALFDFNRILFQLAVNVFSVELSSVVVIDQYFVYLGMVNYVFMVVTLINIIHIVSGRRINKLIWFQQIVILLYSFGSSGLANLITSVIFIFFSLSKRLRILLPVLLVPLFLLVVLVFQDKLLDSSIKLRLNQSVDLLNKFSERPFLGHGFGAYLGRIDSVAIDAVKPYQFEMDVFSLLMKTGLIVYPLYLVPVIYLCYLFVKKFNVNGLIIFLGFLICIFSNGGFMTSIYFTYIVSILTSLLFGLENYENSVCSSIK